MLETSFTIRPAVYSSDGAKDGGVEVELRDPKDSTATNAAGAKYTSNEKPTMIHNPSHEHHYARRVSEEQLATEARYRDPSEAFRYAAEAIPLYNPYPQPQKRQKRVFAESYQPRPQPRQQHAQQPRISSKAHRIPVEESSHPPDIRRIPYDFGPPSREEYWKDRCLRVQNAYYQNRFLLKEMKEDQKQLLRRVQQLEKQLLLESSYAANAEKERGEKQDDNSLTLDDSREYEEEDPRLNAEPEERVRDNSKSERKKSPKNRRGGLPAFLSIPKCVPAAACFYLTDGEGLSDSELVDEEEEVEYAEREEAPHPWAPRD